MHLSGRTPTSRCSGETGVGCTAGADHLIKERPEAAAEIAFHLVEAGQTARALPYLVAAGDQAARAMSLTEAIRLYSKALDHSLDEVNAEVAARAHEGLGLVYTLIPDLSSAALTYQQLLELGRERGEPTMQVTALNRLGFTSAAIGGDLELATNYLERARTLAEAHHDDLGLAEYHLNSCMIATGQGDMERAAAHDAGAAVSGAAAGSTRFRMQGLIQRAISLASAGRYAEGEIALEDAARAARESGDEVFRAAVDAVAAPIYLLRKGRVQEAYASARSGFETMKRHGSSWAAEAAMVASDTARELGRYQDSLTLAQDSILLAEELRQLYIRVSSMAHLARLHAEVRRDPDEADRWRAQTLELVKPTTGRNVRRLDLGPPRMGRALPGSSARSGRLLRAQRLRPLCEHLPREADVADRRRRSPSEAG
jgi:tetratricopeptide (TPR) repeat protein